jgi:acyl phosphate:glycerol-3-phosphate acyltransferase
LLWLEFVAWLVAAYLFGSIPVAFLVAKGFWGKDIRQYGSGQVGGSNLFRSFSKPAGIAVGVYDAGKGVLLVWVTHLLGLTLAMQICVGIAVVVGHNWPVFLHFNAGRGLATTAGIGFYLVPWSILPFAAIAALTLLLGASPLPMLIGVAAIPVTSYLLHKPLEVTLGLIALLLIMIARRLTAPRNARSLKVPRRELYLNRFLFDRDIKDGNAWIYSKPSESEHTQKQDKGSEKKP